MTLHDLQLRLRAAFTPRRTERELDEELTFHIACETEKLVAGGMTPPEANRLARARFGSMASTADACRDERGAHLVDALRWDLTYALRTIRRAPLTAITIIATVGVGLGLVATVFTFFNAYFLRAEAVRNPHELVMVRRTFTPGRSSIWFPFTRSEYERLRAGTGVLVDAAAMSPAGTTRINGLLTHGTLVTGNFFQVLGATAAIGRPLTPADDAGARVVVLSHNGWNRLLSASPAAVGQTVLVNGAAYEITGVMPHRFRGLSFPPPDFWAPMVMAGELGPPGTIEQDPRVQDVVGRVRAGVSPDGAAAALTAWATGAGLREMGDRQPDQQPRYIALTPSTVTLPLTAGPLVALFTAAFFALGLVLLIGCANVANLLLARAVERQREISARMALGASRARMAQQLLTESLLLAVAAAAFGFAVSRFALAAGAWVVRAGAPGGVAEWLLAEPPTADWRVALFLCAGAVIATALFGLMPALQGTRLDHALRTLRGDAAGDAGPGVTRQALIAAQVGASALLLIGAVVFLRGAAAATATDHGVRTTDTILVPLTNDTRHSALRAEVTAHPAVAAVAVSSARFGLQGALTTVEALADAAAHGIREPAAYQFVSPGYFDVLGLQVVAGRTFASSEHDPGAGVAVLADYMVPRLFPDGTAVGRSVRVRTEEPSQGDAADTPQSTERTYTVIGVVRTPESRVGSFARGFSSIYLPMPHESPGAELAVRVRGDPDRVRLALLERLTRVDPGLGDIVTLRSMFEIEEHLLRIGFLMLIVVAALALGLTLSGLFGVLSYLVARRTTEIGVRVALGATTWSIARLVLSQSIRAVMLGLVAGAVLAGTLATGLMATPAAIPLAASSIDVYDPLAYAGSLTLIALACVVAASLPAVRAAQIDPAATLKHE